MRKRAGKGLQPRPRETGKGIPGEKRGAERRGAPREGGRRGSRQERSQAAAGMPAPRTAHAHRVVCGALSAARSA